MKAGPESEVPMSQPSPRPVRRFVIWTTSLFVLGVLIYAFSAKLSVFGQGFHAVFAIILGVGATIAMAVGLMALTFHSSRSGHDEDVGDQ